MDDQKSVLILISFKTVGLVIRVQSLIKSGLKTGINYLSLTVTSIPISLARSKKGVIKSSFISSL